MVASLGVLFLIRGFLFVSTNSRSITLLEIDTHWMYPMLVGKIYGFPVQVLWALGFVIFSYYLFNRHVFGIHVHHVGDIEVSAAQMGVNVKAVKIIAFISCCFYRRNSLLGWIGNNCWCCLWCWSNSLYGIWCCGRWNERNLAAIL